MVDAELHQEDEVRARSKAGLDRVKPFLRARLASTLDLKRLPTLSFTFVGVSSEPEAQGGAPWPE